MWMGGGRGPNAISNIYNTTKTYKPSSLSVELDDLTGNVR